MATRDWWNGLLNAIDAKDTPRFLAYLADDAEFRFGNGPPVFGHENIGAVVSGFFGAIRSSRHELLKTWDAADSVVCEGRVTYTRHDGSTTTLPFVDVLHLRGEKIGRYFIYMDVNPLFAGS